MGVVVIGWHPSQMCFFNSKMSIESPFILLCGHHLYHYHLLLYQNLRPGQNLGNYLFDSIISQIQILWPTQALRERCPRKQEDWDLGWLCLSKVRDCLCYAPSTQGLLSLSPAKWGAGQHHFSGPLLLAIPCQDFASESSSNSAPLHLISFICYFVTC